MAQGFVYIFLNPSFPDQVKIGRTEKTVKLRAKQLRTTGVPTDFIVIYDELVSNCEVVEYLLHRRFADYRTSIDREFFRIPVREAVRALLETSAPYKICNEASSYKVEILSSLKQKYEHYLKPNIISIAIVQLIDICFLEVTRLTYPRAKDTIVERMDLSIFGADGGEMFPTTVSVEINATRFLNELDDYDLIMTGAPLFTSEACNQIAYEWEEAGKLEQRSSR